MTETLRIYKEHIFKVLNTLGWKKHRMKKSKLLLLVSTLLEWIIWNESSWYRTIVFCWSWSWCIWSNKEWSLYCPIYLLMTKNKGKNVGQLKDSQLLVTFFKYSTKTTQSTSFRQYYPNKRHRYGFLLKSLNDLQVFLQTKHRLTWENQNKVMDHIICMQPKIM